MKFDVAPVRFGGAAAAPLDEALVEFYTSIVRLVTGDPAIFVGAVTQPQRCVTSDQLGDKPAQAT